MVPVLAVGFADLQLRYAAQEQEFEAHKEKLSEFASNIEAFSHTHHVVTLVKLEEYKRRHNQIVHKVLQAIEINAANENSTVVEK
jgi:hypothetical protein